MAYGSYERGDLSLQDLILHCPADLVPGVVPYYDGRNWRLIKLADIAEDLPKIIEELDEFEEKFDIMMKQIDEALEKAESIARDNPEEVRFALVQMDGDTETIFEDSFITADSDVIQTWISGEPNGIIETYTGDGYVIIRSNEDETGIVRLRISKAKNGAFLNHL